MLVMKYSKSEICEMFEKHIDDTYGQVELAGELMKTSEILSSLDEKYDHLLCEYMEENVNKFYEYVDTSGPIGGRM